MLAVLCDRCNGPMFLDRVEEDRVCLMCGHRAPLRPQEPLRKPHSGQGTKYDTEKHGT